MISSVHLLVRTEESQGDGARPQGIAIQQGLAMFSRFSAESDGKLAKSWGKVQENDGENHSWTIIE